MYNNIRDTGQLEIMWSKEVKKFIIVCLLVFVNVGFIALLTGTLVRFVAYSSHHFVAYPYPSSIRFVTQKVSSIFCEGVSLRSDSGKDVFTSYLLHNKPRLQYSIIRFNKTNTNMILNPNGYRYFSYYLNSGSVYIFRLKAWQNGATIYIIKGRENMAKWMEQRHCEHCTFRTAPYPCYRPYCLFADRRNTVTQDDEYFFIMSETRGSSSKISVDLDIWRRPYDLANYSNKCGPTTSCYFRLFFAGRSNEIIAVQAARKDLKASIISSCRPRNWAYGLFFGAIPAYLALLIVLIIAFDKKMKKLRAQHQARNNQVTASNSETVFFTHHQMEPPAYIESVPSYEEAMSSSQPVNAAK